MLARLSVLCAGALLLASSAVSAGTLSIAATTPLTTQGVFDGALANDERTAVIAGQVARFSITWTGTPATSSTFSLTCSDPSTSFTSFINFANTNSPPENTMLFSGTETEATFNLLFGDRTTQVNRKTTQLITCTAASTDTTTFPDPATIRFNLGGVLDVTASDSGLVTPGGAKTLRSIVSPATSMGVINEGSAVLDVACTAGTVNGTSSTTQTWDLTTAIQQTVAFVAPAIPTTPITCTFTGATPANPTSSYNLFDYYSVSSAQFTMTLPTITLGTVSGGVVTAGTNSAVTITLSDSATALVLTPTCSNGIGARPTVTIASGTSGTFSIGSSLSAAATGVSCTLAFTSGDAFYTNALASNAVTFDVVVPAVSSSASNAVSSSASVVASSSATNAGSSAPAGGASSSTGSACIAGVTAPSCSAPASLKAGMAMIVLAAAAILALMQ